MEAEREAEVEPYNTIHAIRQALESDSSAALRAVVQTLEVLPSLDVLEQASFFDHAAQHATPETIDWLFYLDQDNESARLLPKQIAHDYILSRFVPLLIRHARFDVARGIEPHIATVRAACAIPAVTRCEWLRELSVESRQVSLVDIDYALDVFKFKWPNAEDEQVFRVHFPVTMKARMNPDVLIMFLDLVDVASDITFFTFLETTLSRILFRLIAQSDLPVETIDRVLLWVAERSPVEKTHHYIGSVLAIPAHKDITGMFETWSSPIDVLSMRDDQASTKYACELLSRVEKWLEADDKKDIMQRLQTRQVMWALYRGRLGIAKTLAGIAGTTSKDIRDAIAGTDFNETSDANRSLLSQVIIHIISAAAITQDENCVEYLKYTGATAADVTSEENEFDTKNTLRAFMEILRLANPQQEKFVRPFVKRWMKWLGVRWDDINWIVKTNSLASAAAATSLRNAIQ